MRAHPARVRSRSGRHAAVTDDASGASPEPGEAPFTRAVALQRDGRGADAIAQYREAIDLGLPDELGYPAHVGLAGCLREAGRPDEATALDREAAARWPERHAARLREGD